MGCPQCQSNEISDSGQCLVCGYQMEPEKQAEAAEAAGRDEGSSRSMIEMDYSTDAKAPEEKEDLPPWRQELSQRLQAIKQKRENSGDVKPQAVVVPPVALPVKPTENPPAPNSAPKLARMPVRSPERPLLPRPSAPRQKALQPVEPKPIPVPVNKAPEPEEIQKLIDSAVSRQSAGSPVSEPVISYPAPLQPPHSEGKLILLSRTLSGLIDLIFIILCTGAFIIAADFFSGIVVLDFLSLVDFAVLFLMTYFVYSIYFLVASGQTIGMMITELRVTGSDEKRPPLRQLLSRCFGYLLSLLVLGIGLLWGLFDRESLCFHDRISHTRVVRLRAV